MADVTVNGVTATADEVLALVRAQADIARREAADRARGYDAAQTLACNTVRAHVVDATRLLMRALECIGSDEATDVLLTAAKSIALASSVNDQITRDDLSAFGVAK